jgi:hypothetical protein
MKGPTTNVKLQQREMQNVKCEMQKGKMHMWQCQL